ncbi:MAG TPA: hypothetical protein VHD87_15585 [Acidimicrobiales bacterium]|nr:hypothetical protein [Acidimicrobiales bacterium]
MGTPATPDKPRRALRRAAWLAASTLAGIATAAVLYAVLYSPPAVVAGRALHDHTPPGKTLTRLTTHSAELGGTNGPAGMRAAVTAIRAAATRHGWHADPVTTATGEPPSYGLHTTKDASETTVTPVERVNGSPYTGDGAWTLNLSVRDAAAPASAFLAKGLFIALAPLLAAAYAYAWVWVRRVMNAGPPRR